MQDARRDEVKNELVLPHHDRMARIMAPLVAGHDVGALSEQIDDLSFSFVAPLGANNDKNRHCSSFTVLRGGLFAAPQTVHIPLYS